MSGTAPTPYAARPALPTQTRRLLLISYHFPPSLAVGGLRWQKMLRFAAERGWGADVIALDPADLEGRDDGRLEELPDGVAVYGVPAAESPITGGLRRLRRLRESRHRQATGGAQEPVPGGGAAASSGAAANVSLSRREVLTTRVSARAALRRRLIAWDSLQLDDRWAGAVERLAHAILDPTHQVVISSGPPHMAHVAGRRIARARVLPHVADLRDLWSLVERVPERYATPYYFAAHDRRERAVMDDAALVVANTELAARALRDKYPRHADRVVAVMNGSDPIDVPPAERDGAFVLFYAGSIYLDRDPGAVFAAAGRLVRELALTPAHLRFEFCSSPQHPSGRPLVDVAADYGLEGHVVVHGFRPHREVLQRMAASTMLVSLPQDSHMAVPSKIFEYAQFDAWLLALAESGSATALVLEGTEADVVDPKDAVGIEAVLRRRYAQFAAGARPAAVGRDGRFSRRRQAEALLARLESLAAR